MIPPERDTLPEPTPLQICDFDDDQMKDFVERIEGNGKVKPSGLFTEALKQCMKKYDITVEELAHQAGLSPRTIGSMRNDVEYTPELEHIIAVCIGMQARPSDSYRLIELAGYKMKQSRANIWYCYLLDTAYKCSRDDCNKLLKKLNITLI